MMRWMSLVAVGGLVVAGCATNEKVKFSDPPAGLFPEVTNGAAPKGGSALAAVIETGDRFQVGDQVTVKFSGTTDENLRPHEERIKEDGTITLPYIGAVKAAGLTPGELQKDITTRYVPDYYKRLTVTVTGEQRVYSVGGQVRSPGRQVYIGPTTVIKAIQSAGDFTDFAAKWRVELTRADGRTLKVDCEKAAKDPALDLPVYPGDKIIVPQRGPGEIIRW
jgi:polysaccharide export outer membrane protein